MITTLALSPAQARWHRMARQSLLTPMAGAAEVARWLAGVQAQILPAAGLALWNRARPFTADTLARQLYAGRSLVKLWGQRGTLHLYPSKDKGDLVDAACYARVWRPAGHIEATLLVAGRIAGTWRYDWRGRGVAITIDSFKRPPAYMRRAAERQARGVAEHFGTPLAELTWRDP